MVWVLDASEISGQNIYCVDDVNIKEDFLQEEEEEEATMMNILLDHGPRVGVREEGPFGSKSIDVVFSQVDTCVVSASQTQIAAAP